MKRGLLWLLALALIFVRLLGQFSLELARRLEWDSDGRYSTPPPPPRSITLCLRH